MERRVPKKFSNGYSTNPIPERLANNYTFKSLDNEQVFRPRFSMTGTWYHANTNRTKVCGTKYLTSGARDSFRKVIFVWNTTGCPLKTGF
jgi:hypothetical protein